jgi:hypothetical protein
MGEEWSVKELTRDNIEDIALDCAPQSRQVVKVCFREGNHGKNTKKKIYT